MAVLPVFENLKLNQNSLKDGQKKVLRAKTGPVTQSTFLLLFVNFDLAQKFKTVFQ
jgi:hypothetical protein